MAGKIYIKLTQTYIKRYLEPSIAAEQRVFFTIIEQTNASQTHPVLQIVFKLETTGLCSKRQSNTKARNEVFNDAIICIGARW